MNFRNFLTHTLKYYEKNASKLKLSTAATLTLGSLAAASVLQITAVYAGPFGYIWQPEDVLNDEIFRADYDAVIDTGYTPEVTQGFHLQMPVTLDEYLDSTTYVNPDTTDKKNLKLNGMLENSLKESYFDFTSFDIRTPEDWETDSEKFLEFFERGPGKH